jgi:hypothetical protein
MIKQFALLIFGWRRTPEKFVPRCAGYVSAYLTDHDPSLVGKLPPACLISLSQLAYSNARKEGEQKPRFIHLVRELENVSRDVRAVMRMQYVTDERVRSLLELHCASEGSNARSLPSEKTA